MRETKHQRISTRKSEYPYFVSFPYLPTFLFEWRRGLLDTQAMKALLVDKQELGPPTPK